MNYDNATNQQLLTIINHDKECPTDLLGGVNLELIKRRLWDGIIMYAAKQAFINLNFVLKHRLQMDHEELIHIGHIEITKQLERFKQGMRTFKTFVIMCLISKFKKMRRDCTAEMRYSNIGTKDVDNLDEKIQTKIFQSPVNVERAVINKLTLEGVWHILNNSEKKAIALEQYGYSQYEISGILGFNKTYANTLLNRAYKKLRKELKEQIV